jgi:hypothetical protein
VFQNCFMKSYPALISKIILTLFIAFNSRAQTNVLTQHNNLNRTGWYDHETILNTKNVKPGSFGKIFARSVDDQIYAQPLVMLKLNMPGVGVKNVVFVATVNNSVYAFDADSVKANNPFWQVSLTPPGSRPVNNLDILGDCGGPYTDFSGNIGIVGTPVIDSATKTMYLVARSANAAGEFQQYLHALDITTGLQKANSPKLITAQVSGSGVDNENGIINFNSQRQNQRCGLLLLNGIVYISWASHCDWGPYHGWIVGYNKTSLSQTIVYNSTPDGQRGGIWMSAGAPSADESGNIYVAVGNGSVGKNNDPADLRNRSESTLKLIPSGSSLTISSFFTPRNFPDLEADDLDMGVAQTMLIPGTNRVMTANKDGILFLLNRDNMGGYNAVSDNIVQMIDFKTFIEDFGVYAHMHSSLAYYKGQQKELVYFWSEYTPLLAFPYSRITNKLSQNDTVGSRVQGPIGHNGAFLSVSSNGSVDSTAILWASHAADGDANHAVRPGILRAFDANDVTKELWNSKDSADMPGNYAKFNCPTIVNGKVYLATFSNKLIVYGLTAATQKCIGSNNWIGSASAAWENGNNWSCGVVPDANSVIIIGIGHPNNPIINSNVTVKSVTQNTGANLTVNPGFRLEIIGSSNQ